MADNEEGKEKPKLALVASMPLEAMRVNGNWTMKVYSGEALVFSGRNVVDWGPWDDDERDIKYGYLYIDQKIKGGIKRTFIGPNDDEYLIIAASVNLTNEK